MLKTTMARPNDSSTILKKVKIKPCQNPSCQHLADRVHELEKELQYDLHYYPVPQLFSPYSAITPCSNISANGFPNYSYLFSPNTAFTAQRSGLSPRVFERAHDIPERFWIDWQQKQIQNRSEDSTNSATNTRRRSLLSLHQNQYRRQSSILDRIASASIDTESYTSSSDENSPIVFDRRSNDRLDLVNLKEHSLPPPSPKSQSTLDRSRLTIPLAFSFSNLPTQSTQHLSLSKESISSIGSCQDIAQIDTELQITVLSQENQNKNNPLLYSKAILNRHIELRSVSKKEFQVNYFSHDLTA